MCHQTFEVGSVQQSSNLMNAKTGRMLFSVCQRKVQARRPWQNSRPTDYILDLGPPFALCFCCCLLLLPLPLPAAAAAASAASAALASSAALAAAAAPLAAAAAAAVTGC